MSFIQRRQLQQTASVPILAGGKRPATKRQRESSAGAKSFARAEQECTRRNRLVTLPGFEFIAGQEVDLARAADQAHLAGKFADDEVVIADLGGFDSPSAKAARKVLADLGDPRRACVVGPEHAYPRDDEAYYAATSLAWIRRSGAAEGR